MTTTPPITSAVKPSTTHVPVLLSEMIALLDPRPGERFIDGTYGGGGHSDAILKRLGHNGRLLAIDWNDAAARECNEYYGDDQRVTCVVGNFAELPAIMRLARMSAADGLILDLGVSSNELDRSGRGFSFQENEPLIMTYNDAEQPIRALLNSTAEETIADIIHRFGEERYARRIAHAVVEERKRKPIETTSDLVDIISAAAPRRGRLHPATRTFMALRIYANHELENLESVIPHLPDILARGGRAAIISFHSLEDRIVKYGLRSLARAGAICILTPKPITPTREEINRNPRARSAKLRACIRP